MVLDTAMDIPATETGASPIAFTGWLMEYYRVMGTRQICDGCGSEREGNVASEPYVVCSRSVSSANATAQASAYSQAGPDLGGNLKSSSPTKKHYMTVKVSTVLERYSYYLRTKKNLWQYLPSLPCRTEWVEQHVQCCPLCYDGSNSVASIHAMPEMLPCEIPSVQVIEQEKAQQNRQHNKESKKAKPREKKKINSLADLMKGM